MTIIADSLQAIQANIRAALTAVGRKDNAQLLAVSKAQSAEKLRSAYLAGQRAFGENYVQEAINKQQQLSDLSIEWHFIGPIQSNKTQLIAQHFDWVHSVDRLKIAERLSSARSPSLTPLNVCIQINSSEESTKSGANLTETITLANAINALPNLKLRGLMAIPAPAKDFDAQRAQFKIVHDAFITLQQQGFAIDTLSIGMSEDYVAAIHEGATIVRIGSALFGARQPINRTN
ncbi:MULTISPECIES: YggS family pyridoxal phosphate-dependent enzyme [Methylotenera]|uniref:YggS family pyridoxal phosphate-dependent enzyme n=1 Tax=Methylotenera TaxID=359407 RepID=UPI0003782407|nr:MULTISPECIES: YggS family pyridoxal phosphate-dependent enzyme [Methylotenera]